MKDFSEQREQSDACIGYVESRGDWAKPMKNEEYLFIIIYSLFNVICSFNKRGCEKFRSLFYLALLSPNCLKSTTLVIPSGGRTKKAPSLPSRKIC